MHPGLAAKFCIPIRSQANCISFPSRMRFILSACPRQLFRAGQDQSMNEFYDAFAPQGLKREALHSSYAMAENVFTVSQSGPQPTASDLHG